MTYWVVALLPFAVLPKWAAARTASAARSDWRGRDGAAEPLSYHTPASIPEGLPAFWPLVPQNVVPDATPWQYCTTLFSHALPPTSPRKFCTSVASPDGSFPVHCDPQRMRYTFGAVSTPMPPVPP